MRESSPVDSRFAFPRRELWGSGLPWIGFYYTEMEGVIFLANLPRPAMGLIYGFVGARSLMERSPFAPETGSYADADGVSHTLLGWLGWLRFCLNQKGIKRIQGAINSGRS